MDDIDLSFRDVLGELADEIDLSPRQWFLLAESIRLGDRFRRMFHYDVPDREDAREALRERAAKRLLRNSGEFVQWVNDVEDGLALVLPGAERHDVLRLADDAPLNQRKAQVAISWLRIRGADVHNGWTLVCPLMGLVLPGETVESPAHSDSESIDLHLDEFGLEELDDVEFYPHVLLTDFLDRLDLTCYEWELLGARFGPSGTTDSGTIAADFQMTRAQLLDLIADIQDRLLERWAELDQPLKVLERHVASAWPLRAPLSLRQAGAHVRDALEAHEIESEFEDASRLLNVCRALDKLIPNPVDKYPRIQERIRIPLGS